MKGFFFALLASLVLLVCAPGLCPAQTYDFRAAPTLVAKFDVYGAMTAKKLTIDSLVGINYRGLWKGKDTTLFGVLGRASTWTGRQTFGDLITTDSTITVTLDASGAIKGATTLGITGVSTLTGGATIGASGLAMLKVMASLSGDYDSMGVVVAGDTIWWAVTH